MRRHHWDVLLFPVPAAESMEPGMAASDSTNSGFEPFLHGTGFDSFDGYAGFNGYTGSPDTGPGGPGLDNPGTGNISGPASNDIYELLRTVRYNTAVPLHQTHPPNPPPPTPVGHFQQSFIAPMEEFHVNCYMEPADQEANNGLFPIFSPVVTCFIPSLPRGTPFQISIHRWNSIQPFLNAVGPDPLGEDQYYQIRVIIDGKVVVAQAHHYATQWPIKIAAYIPQDGEGFNGPRFLEFPEFPRQIVPLDQAWVPYDLIGRIRVEISVGHMQIGTFIKAKNVVSFAFLPVPHDYLMRWDLAWPNKVIAPIPNLRVDAVPHQLTQAMREAMVPAALNERLEVAPEFGAIPQSQQFQYDTGLQTDQHVHAQYTTDWQLHQGVPNAYDFPVVPVLPSQNVQASGEYPQDQGSPGFQSHNPAPAPLQPQGVSHPQFLSQPKLVSQSIASEHAIRLAQKGMPGRTILPNGPLPYTQLQEANVSPTKPPPPSYKPVRFSGAPQEHFKVSDKPILHHPQPCRATNTSNVLNRRDTSDFSMHADRMALPSYTSVEGLTVHGSGSLTVNPVAPLMTKGLTKDSDGFVSMNAAHFPPMSVLSKPLSSIEFTEPFTPSTPHKKGKGNNSSNDSGKRRSRRNESDGSSDGSSSLNVESDSNSPPHKVRRFYSDKSVQKDDDDEEQQIDVHCNNEVDTFSSLFSAAD